MDDKFPPDENSARDDFEVSPESGSGPEAANFSAKAQQEKFLGGSGAKPTTEKYLPDQKLTREQKGTERDNIVRELGDIIRGDDQIPSEFKDEYPDKSRDTTLAFNRANLSLKRGAGKYSMIIMPLGEKGRRYALSLGRTEGNITQTLEVDGPDHPEISYRESDSTRLITDTTGMIAGQHSQIDHTGLAINKGMELLAKVKEDFKSPAGNEPVEFNSRERIPPDIPMTT